MTATIRDLTVEDEPRWRALWAGYLDFYGKADLDPAVTENTWAMVSDERDDVFALVADGEAGVVGFVNCVVHPNTWVNAPICYLEDLFVDDKARGQGAGRALIDAVVDRARANGWGRVYWRTHEDNRARTLYDRVTPPADWVVYEIEL